jgi:hypothetical protein
VLGSGAGVFFVWLQLALHEKECAEMKFNFFLLQVARHLMLHDKQCAEMKLIHDKQCAEMKLAFDPVLPQGEN